MRKLEVHEWDLHLPTAREWSIRIKLEDQSLGSHPEQLVTEPLSASHATVEGAGSRCE